jgi:hypothetical protein
LRDTSADDARKVRVDDHREESFVPATAPASPFAVRCGGAGAFLRPSSDGRSILLGQKDGGPGVDEDGPKVATLPALGCLSGGRVPAAQSMSEQIDTDALRYMRRP